MVRCVTYAKAGIKLLFSKKNDEMSERLAALTISEEVF
jgi:hypothetical protein